MSARRISLLAALVTMAASGWYVFIYLARWEWNRALISGVIFIAAEVGVIGALVLERAARIERRLDGIERARPDKREPDPLVLDRLRETAPPPSAPFAWLVEAKDRTNVFVPILLGAGVVLSAVAWVVERLARMTARPVLEQGLARQLLPIALPAEPLVGHRDAPDPFRPGP